MEHWGRRLAGLRNGRGFTQIALSVACGWTGNGTIARLEGRAGQPSAKTVAILARALGYSEAVIRGDAEPDASPPALVSQITGTSARADDEIQPSAAAPKEVPFVSDDPLFAAVVKLWMTANPHQRRRALHVLSSETDTLAVPSPHARRGEPQSRGTPRARASGD